MTVWILILLLSPALAAAPQAQSLQVRHDHDPWGQCRGELTIGQEGIEYLPLKKKNHRRYWKWEDIQSFDRKSEGQFSLLTYEDLKWRFGQDRFFDFKVLPPSEPLSGAAFGLIAERLGKPVTDRMGREIESQVQLAAKHLHSWGGCQGVLRIGPQWIVYQTDHPGHARSWKRSRDVESVWSADRFHLELHTFEYNQRSFESTRRFRFQLKQPLEQSFYEQLRREMVPGW